MQVVRYKGHGSILENYRYLRNQNGWSDLLTMLWHWLGHVQDIHVLVFKARRREFESRLPLHVALGLASRPKNKMVSGKYTRCPQNSREIGKKLTNFRAFSFTLFLLHGLASEC